MEHCYILTCEDVCVGECVRVCVREGTSVHGTTVCVRVGDIEYGEIRLIAFRHQPVDSRRVAA